MCSWGNGEKQRWSSVSLKPTICKQRKGCYCSFLAQASWESHKIGKSFSHSPAPPPVQSSWIQSNFSTGKARVLLFPTLSPKEPKSERVSHGASAPEWWLSRAGSPSARLPPSGSLAETSENIMNSVLQASVWIMLSSQMHSFFCLGYFFPPPFILFCLLHQAQWHALHLSPKSALRLPAWAAKPQKPEALHHFSPPSEHLGHNSLPPVIAEAARQVWLTGQPFTSLQTTKIRGEPLPITST